jgi:predicted TIM-barrel fold metal-dependent hydrolase
MASRRPSAEIRRSLSHPVIDADGHQIELEPLLFEFLEQAGGRQLAEDVRARFARAFRWYELSPEQRRAQRVVRPPWGLQARNSDDLAACMLPGLFRQRMDEIGIDFAIIYPTMGIAHVRQANEQRSAVCRAINHYYAEVFRGHGDRLVPAAIVPMSSPAEAIAELEHAVQTLGHKTIVIDCAFPRVVPALADAARAAPPELRGLFTWLDTFGTDSEHDYDPFWRRCIELGIAPTAHMAGMWGTRTSVSSYVHNYLGMFGAAGEALAKSLFLAGVTFRFPDLRIAFLEGGAGWACSLYADLIEHWEKRNNDAVAAYDPALLDRDRLSRLLREHGGPRVARLLDRPFDEGFRNLQLLSGWLPEAGWQGRTRTLLDEFHRCPIGRPEDIRDHFTRGFFFGCEAEDPSVAWALDGRTLPFGARLNAMFGSDIGHWDVDDMSTVLAHAYRMVEDGMLDHSQFRRWVFANAVVLHGSGNPGFFRGTAIESAAAAVLAGHDGRDGRERP